MKSTGIDTIIFDVGNVLMDFNWQYYLNSFHFDDTKYNLIADATFRNSLWDEYDRGGLPDEEYFNRFAANAPQYQSEIRRILTNVGETVRLFDYTVDWVKHLKKEGYRLYILSNYAHYTYQQTVHKMEFLPYMDGTLFSYTVQQRKPYHCIYKTLLEKYHITPERAVFLDDRTDNIQSARDMGINGIIFTGYQQALQELKACEVY